MSKQIDYYVTKWDSIVRYCSHCGTPMTLSDEEDFGTLCESCYQKEYYD